MNPLKLFDQFRYYIIGGFFLLMLGVLAIKYYQVSSLKAKLAESTAQVVILSASIENQNKSIAKQAEDSLKRIQSSQDALKQAYLANGINQSRIVALKSQLGKIKSCDSAVLEAKGNL